MTICTAIGWIAFAAAIFLACTIALAIAIVAIVNRKMDGADGE